MFISYINFPCALENKQNITRRFLLLYSKLGSNIVTIIHIWLVIVHSGVDVSHRPTRGSGDQLFVWRVCGVEVRTPRWRPCAVAAVVGNLILMKPFPAKRVDQLLLFCMGNPCCDSPQLLPLFGGHHWAQVVDNRQHQRSSPMKWYIYHSLNKTRSCDYQLVTSQSLHQFLRPNPGARERKCKWQASGSQGSWQELEHGSPWFGTCISK